MPEQLADPDAAAALAERDGQSTATQLAGAEGVGPQSRGHDRHHARGWPTGRLRLTVHQSTPARLDTEPDRHFDDRDRAGLHRGRLLQGSGPNRNAHLGPLLV